jgi:hypothetical protein
MSEDTYGLDLLARNFGIPHTAASEVTSSNS